MSSRAAISSLLALLLTACIGPQIWTLQLTGWQQVESRDFRILSDAPSAVTDALASDLAHVDAAFAHLIGHRIESPGPPPTIYLIRDRHLARRFGLNEDSPGWAVQDLEGTSIAVFLAANGSYSRRVLFHEYTHLLLNRNQRAPLPNWYNEGLAEYFSTLWFQEGELIVGSVLDGRLQWVVDRRALPLDRLFSEAYWDMELSRVMDYYATSWALTHYLMGSRTGRSELSRFAGELARGVPADAARISAFERTSEHLEDELETHLGYLARRVSAETVLDPRGIVIARPPRGKALSEGEVAYELGRLALAHAGDEDGRSRALAQKFLERAVEVAPSDARAQAALAQAYAAGGDASRARASIDIALHAAPSDSRVRLCAGRIALAENSLNEAVKHFRAALGSEEELFIPARLGLGLSLVRLDRSREALKEFESARKTTWTGKLNLEIGRLHLAAGRRVAALGFLRPLAQDPHRGSIGDEAAELLRLAGHHPVRFDGSP